MKNIQTQKIRRGTPCAPFVIVGVLAILLAGPLGPTGCATTPEQKISQVQSLSYAAASVGTQIALQQNPAWRPEFETAYAQLDQLVTQKAITGDLLRKIMAALPVKELKSPEAIILITAATTLYDVTVGTAVSIEAQPYVAAAATGIRDGLKLALGK